jgi:C-terminal processing protease CtpA/Prc
MMRTNLGRAVTAALALTIVGVSGVMAQQTERERQRIEEAERRAEEARAELERAMGLLREQESREAQLALRQSISEMQRALRELDRSRLSVSFGTLPELGGVSIVSSFGGPKMGVYLNTERDQAVDSIGAELSSVVDDGPAAEAGLRAGDIITRAQGEALARTTRRGPSPGNRLIEIKDELEVGDTLHIEYRRGAETRTADIVLDDLGDSAWAYADWTDWTDEPRVVVAPQIDVEPRGRISVRTPRLVTELYTGLMSGWLDVELVTLDEDLGRYFGTSEGLLVIKGSEEDELDLRSGDVILNVDGRKPTSQSHLVRIMRSYEAGEELNVEIMRNQGRQVIVLQVPERESNSFRWRPKQEY